MLDGFFLHGAPLPLLALAAAIAVAVFWGTPLRWRDWVLAACSFGLLVVLDPRSLLSLLGLSLAVYYLAPRVGDGRRGKVLLALIVGLLGHLFAYKYLPPLLDGGGARVVAVPLGISYYTFKLIHYAIETRRGRFDEHRLSEYLAYMFLLPTFTAGPIERFEHFAGNRDERFSVDTFVEGGHRIVYGLIKKLVLAANLQTFIDCLGGGAYAVKHLAALSVHRTWLYCILTYLYLYLDFSAYSDLAIGGARLFGIRIMENFRWPILARDIGQFWQRWHITLAKWCQSYVYMPLIGTFRSPYPAVYAAFLAIGLWHAGTLSFVAWGLYHATGVAIFQTWRRIWRRRKWAIFSRRPLTWLGWPVTFLYVSGSFAFALTHAHGGAYAGLRVLAKLIGIDLPALEG